MWWRCRGDTTTHHELGVESAAQSWTRLHRMFHGLLCPRHANDRPSNRNSAKLKVESLWNPILTMVVQWTGKEWSKATCEPPRTHLSSWRAVYNEGLSLLRDCHLPSTLSNKSFPAYLGHQNHHRYSQLKRPYLSTDTPTNPSNWAFFHQFTMHLWIAVALPFFAASALAATAFTGSNSDLLAQPLVNGSSVTQELYDSCKYEAGDGLSEGEECVVKVMKIMVAFMESSTNLPKGHREVVLLNKDNDGQPSPITVDAVPTSSSVGAEFSALKSKRNAAEEDEFLQDMNSHLGRRSRGGREIRAVELGRSEMHPNGGLAIRTNVHDGDAALYVHTNGSHSTVGFKRGTAPSIGKRAGESQMPRSIEFAGMREFKMELELIEGISSQDLRQMFDDLETGLVKLAGGDDGNPPMLRKADAFGIATCRKSNGKMALRGKLISLDKGAGHNFEEDGLINCDEYVIPE